MSAPRVRLVDEHGKPARARELKTFRISGIFKDDAGQIIPAAGFTALILTLFDDATNAIINSVDAAPILNTGRGSVDANGNFVCTLLPGDNPLLNALLAEELHVAFFQWTYAGGAKAGGIEAEFPVHNFVKLP